MYFVENQDSGQWTLDSGHGQTHYRTLFHWTLLRLVTTSLSPSPSASAQRLRRRRWVIWLKSSSKFVWCGRQLFECLRPNSLWPVLAQKVFIINILQQWHPPQTQTIEWFIYKIYTETRILFKLKKKKFRKKWQFSTRFHGIRGGWAICTYLL